MSILDKVAAAVTPLESQADRDAARELARSMAGDGDWLSLVLDHHLQIEGAFDRLKAAAPEERPAAQKALGALLTGHSIAEEVVLYPAMVKAGEQGRATMAYTQQSTAKTEMFLLEGLDPGDHAYLEKLEHIRGAVLHHVYEEEGTWFPDLRRHTLEADQEMLTRRYTEEFDRYMGGGAGSANERPAMFVTADETGGLATRA